MGPVVGVATGWLISGVLFGGLVPQLGRGVLGLLPHVLLGLTVVVFVMMLRRLRAQRAQPPARTVRVASVPAEPAPVAEASILDEGLREIHRMDPKFDPSRFVGYIETVFRATHTARMRRDVASLRDRVTPELYAELQAQNDRLATLGHARHVAQMEIRAEVTEAWHEQGRDYVTAFVDGSMLAYTVDEVTGALVSGSKTVIEKVEAFWTFTRPGGLNFWMLGAIQTA